MYGAVSVAPYYIEKMTDRESFTSREMRKNMSRVFVIGGGASGMVAAIMAARNGHSVTIWEHNDKLGKKLYATGNGKCNLTNSAYSPEYYRGGDSSLVEAMLEQFSVEDTKTFFRSLGLMLKERNGYWYPMSEQAASVVSVLTYELRRLGVRIMLNCDVNGLAKTDERFELSYVHREQGKGTATADKVILACGGKAGQNLGAGDGGYRLAQALGHSVTPLVPALVPLCSKEKWLKTVSGVRLEVGLTLEGVCSGQKATKTERGEMIFADYGISGIPVMQLSRYASEWLDRGAHVCVYVDLLPNVAAAELKKGIEQRISGEIYADRTAEEAMCGILPKKLMYVILKQAAVDPEIGVTHITSRQTHALAALIKGLPIHITGTKPFENAQVTAGGIPLSEVEMHTCQSKLVHGLYLTGELLDVDGTCGGYNLQWAWSTGVIAGQSIS